MSKKETSSKSSNKEQTFLDMLYDQVHTTSFKIPKVSANQANANNSLNKRDEIESEETSKKPIEVTTKKPIEATNKKPIEATTKKTIESSSKAKLSDEDEIRDTTKASKTSKEHKSNTNKENKASIYFV